jgi:hypothetical protein
VDAAGQATTAGLATWGGLATPGVAVLALAAETKRSVSDSATGTLATLLVGENDGKSEIVHLDHLLHLALLRLSGWALLPRYEKSAAGGEDAVTTR